MSISKFDLASLGGAIQNYSPVVDPSTDLDAAFDNQARCIAAENSQTTPKAIVIMSLGAGAALVSYQSAWGNGATYAPTIAKVSTGKFRITFPSSIIDQLGNAQPLVLSACAKTGLDNITGGGSLVFFTEQVETASTVVIQVYNTSFALNDSTSTNLAIVTVF